MKNSFLNLRLLASLCAGWLLIANVTVAATLVEETAFGPNPGNLRLFRYVPDDLPDGAPLVVALHGCQQQAADFDQETGWMQWAERWQFALLLPQQQTANNRLACFNWFRPPDISRGQGEVASVRAMIEFMLNQYELDADHVFVTGLSAGGAMTAALLAAYPDVFAGGAIVAGLPYRCATGLLSAWRCQSWGRDLTPAAWGERVRQATPLNPKNWPRVSIWQGDEDSVVNPVNARELMEQWTNVHDIDPVPDHERSTPRFTHRLYQDVNGQTRVEVYVIPGMGHGMPINPGKGDNNCGMPADYILDQDVCASFRIGRFWGLDRWRQSVLSFSVHSVP